MTQPRQRGMVLILTLLITVILMMLVGILIQRGKVGLYNSAHYRDAIRARQAAKGGVNHLTALLSSNTSFAETLEIDLGETSYTVHFDPTKGHYSTNNLDNHEDSPNLSSQGYVVPPFTADLIVTGTCGNTERTLRVVLQRGVSTGRSVAALGKVTLSGDVEVSGIRSLFPPPGASRPEPAPGGIVSKYQSTGAGDLAITWHELGGSFELSDLSRIETTPASGGGQSVSSNLRALFPERTISDGAAGSVPDIDVAGIVSRGLSAPPLQNPSSLQSGHIYLHDERSRAGDLTLNGSLSLSGGTLYVDGDLTVNGNVEGAGTIYATGNISIRGGNALVMADQSGGAAVLAGGDVNLVGLPVSGYLRALSQDYSFEASVDRLESLLVDYEIASAADAFLQIAGDIGQEDDGYPSLDSHPDQPWISPIAGPNGAHNYGRSNSATARLLLKIKDQHTSLASDESAQKLVHALEQLQFHFRNSDLNVAHDGVSFTNSYAPLPRRFQLEDDYRLSLLPGGVLLTDTPYYLPSPNLIYTGVSDHSAEPRERWAHDRLGGGNLAIHQSRRDVFVSHNDPLSETWLGESSFQGIVYARGSVRAENKFKVVGSLLSLGDISLSGGSTLIFNEDYRELSGAQLPMGLLHYEEL